MVMNIRNKDTSEVEHRSASERREFEAQLRNPLFTEENRKLIIKGMRLGLPPKSACEYAGISLSTFEKWMNKGATTDDLDDPFHIFYLEVRKADRTYESKLVTYCEPIDNPKIAFDMLKARYPEDYGGKTTIEHTGTLNAGLDVKSKKDRLSRIMKANKDSSKNKD